VASREPARTDQPAEQRARQVLPAAVRRDRLEVQWAWRRVASQEPVRRDQPAEQRARQVLPEAARTDRQAEQPVWLARRALTHQPAARMDRPLAWRASWRQEALLVEEQTDRQAVLLAAWQRDQLRVEWLGAARTDRRVVQPVWQASTHRPAARMDQPLAWRASSPQEVLLVEEQTGQQAVLLAAWQRDQLRVEWLVRLGAARTDPRAEQPVWLARQALPHRRAARRDRPLVWRASSRQEAQPAEEQTGQPLELQVWRPDRQLEESRARQMLPAAVRMDRRAKQPVWLARQALTHRPTVRMDRQLAWRVSSRQEAQPAEEQTGQPLELRASHQDRPRAESQALPAAVRMDRRAEQPVWLARQALTHRPAARMDRQLAWRVSSRREVLPAEEQTGQPVELRVWRRDQLRAESLALPEVVQMDRPLAARLASLRLAEQRALPAQVFLRRASSGPRASREVQPDQQMDRPVLREQQASQARQAWRLDRQTDLRALPAWPALDQQMDRPELRAWRASPVSQQRALPASARWRPVGRAVLARLRWVQPGEFFHTGRSCVAASRQPTTSGPLNDTVPKLGDCVPALVPTTDRCRTGCDPTFRYCRPLRSQQSPRAHGPIVDSSNHGNNSTAGPDCRSGWQKSDSYGHRQICRRNTHGRLDHTSRSEDRLGPMLEPH
jgi:hypothetical protein